MICIGMGVFGGIRRLVIQTPATEAKELAALIVSIALVAAGLVLLGIHFSRDAR